MHVAIEIDHTKYVFLAADAARLLSLVDKLGQRFEYEWRSEKERLAGKHPCKIWKERPDTHLLHVITEDVYKEARRVGDDYHEALKPKNAKALKKRSKRSKR
jgi:hypothetical protein